MSMKKKIRKSFDAAAPDVLGRILRDCGEPEAKTAAPVEHPKKKIPHWVTELASTAAAIALLIAVAGGSYLYLRSQIPGYNPHGAVGSTGDSIGSSIPDLSADNLASRSAGLVCPEGIAVDFAGYDLELAQEQGQDDTCLITVHYKGYTYKFTYTNSGELIRLEIPLCDCVKEGYISEQVARQIVLLNHSDAAIVTAGGLWVVSDDDAYYRIDLTGETDEWYACYFVNAMTGEIVEPTFADIEDILITQTEDIIYPLALRDSMYRVPDIAVELIQENGKEYYEITRTDGSHIYIFHFDSQSLQLTSIEIPLLDIASGRISKYLAIRKLLLEYSLEPGRSLYEYDCSVVTIGGMDYYRITIPAEDEQELVSTLCYVDAFTGEIVEFDDLDPTYGEIDFLTAKALVMDYLGCTQEEADIIYTNYGKNTAGDYNYTFRLFANGRLEDVGIRAYSGEILWHDTEDQSEAIARFNTLFGDIGSYYNWALNSFYSDPAEMNLNKLFKNADSSDYLMPAVEWYGEWYNSLPEFERELDHNLIAGALMEDVLEEYFGISLADMDENSFSGLTEIRLIGWYSCVANDFEVTEDFAAHGYETLENGDIMLFYTSANSKSLCAVTLRPNGDGYLILSNMLWDASD